MIHRTQLATVETKLKDLGIEQESMWQEFNVILSRVSGFSPVYDEDDLIEQEKCLIYLCSDQGYTINTSYKVFNELMNDLYKLNINLAT